MEEEPQKREDKKRKERLVDKTINNRIRRYGHVSRMNRKKKGSEHETKRKTVNRKPETKMETTGWEIYHTEREKNVGRRGRYGEMMRTGC
jgi:hypothetical protein